MPRLFRRASRNTEGSKKSHMPADGLQPSPPPSAPTTPDRGVVDTDVAAPVKGQVEEARINSMESVELGNADTTPVDNTEVSSHSSSPALARRENMSPRNRKPPAPPETEDGTKPRMLEPSLVEVVDEDTSTSNVKAVVVEQKAPEEKLTANEPAVIEVADKTMAASPSVSEMSVSERMSLMLRKEASFKEALGPAQKHTPSIATPTITYAPTSVTMTAASAVAIAGPTPEELAAQAARRAELADKSEAALLSMHLTNYLTADLEAVSGQIIDATAQLKDNESAKAGMESARAAKLAVVTKTTADLDEKLGAYAGALTINERLAKQKKALLAEIDAKAGQLSDGSECNASVRGRVHIELEEAKERMSAQAAAVADLNTELLCFNASVAPKMAKMGVEIMRLTADASAKATCARFAQANLDALSSDLATQEAMLADASLLEAKTGRVDASAKEVDELKVRLAAEKADLVTRKQAEANVDERARLEDLATAATGRKLQHDRDALKGLVKLEDAAIARELGSAPPDSTPTQTVLFDGTRKVIESSRAASGVALAEVEAALAQQAKAVQARGVERATEMRLLRSERLAIEAAHVQRKLYTVEKERQLEVERHEVDRARQELCTTQHAAAALKVELDRAQREAASHAHKAEEAAKARAAKESALRKLRLTSKLRAAALKVRIACEKDVHAEQAKYVETVAYRIETEERIEAKVVADEAADANGYAPGERGRAIVADSGTVHASWVSELRETEAEKAHAKAEVTADLAAHEAQMAAGLRLLLEQHAAHTHAISKLKDYEMRILAATPEAERAAGASAVYATAADELVPNIDSTLPSQDLLTTPYAEAYKYLSSELVNVAEEEPHAVEEDAEQLSEAFLEEANNPLYNPDLAVPTPRMMERMRSRLERI